MNEWMDKWMDGRINGRMNGWMNERPSPSIHTVVHLQKKCVGSSGLRCPRAAATFKMQRRNVSRVPASYGIVEVWRSGWPMLFIITTYLHGKPKPRYVFAVPKGMSCSKCRFSRARKVTQLTSANSWWIANGLLPRPKHVFCIHQIGFL